METQELLCEIFWTALLIGSLTAFFAWGVYMVFMPEDKEEAPSSSDGKK